MLALSRVVTCGRGHRSGSVVRWAAYIVSCTCSKVALSIAQPTAFENFSSSSSRSRLHLLSPPIVLTIPLLRTSSVLSFFCAKSSNLRGVITSSPSARRDTRTFFLRSWAEDESWERRHYAGGGGGVLCHITISVEGKGSCNDSVGRRSIWSVLL